MIVKKLGMVSGGGFPGAGYNERKVAEGVARLMAMENVDAAMRHKVELLHEAGFDCAGEIEKYLKERSRTYGNTKTCLLYTSPSPRDRTRSRMPSSA